MDCHAMSSYARTHTALRQAAMCDLGFSAHLLELPVSTRSPSHTCGIDNLASCSCWNFLLIDEVITKPSSNVGRGKHCQVWECFDPT